MADITVRKDNGGQAQSGSITRQQQDPFRMMRDLLGWDPFREMAPMWSGTSGNVFSPDFEVKETKDSYIFKADVPETYFTTGIDYQQGGNSFHAKLLPVILVAIDRKAVVFVPQIVEHRFPWFIAYCQKDHARIVFVLRIERIPVWQLLSARWAPHRPEVHQDNFAGQIFFSNRISIRIRNGKGFKLF